MQRKPYDINLDEGFTAIKAQENKTLKKKDKKERDGGERKRERELHMRTYSYIHTRIHTLLQFGRRGWGDN